jgi:hypothetical protein
MSWTTLHGHRPTGPVLQEVLDSHHLPRQKCSCGAWYCIEHIIQVTDGSHRVDESEDSLF